jgi:hypothetical protein
MQIDADFRPGMQQGQANNRGIFFQAAPMALICETFAAVNAQSGEQAPPVDEASLTGRQADFFDRQQTIVMKDVTMDHTAPWD